jgi:hypothetical protein
MDTPADSQSSPWREDRIWKAGKKRVTAGRLRQFPVPLRKFPDTPIKFPVPILREFAANLLI